MPKYKKEDIDKIRQTADLYDIVSANVHLKASGTGNFVGLCPFHDEKTPSFHVQPQLGRWHCFGCSEGGDVFSYLEKQDNLSFADAVEMLADKYHIELHVESGSSSERSTGTKRSRLLEVTSEAQNFFAAQLLSQEALPARQLLAGRSFSQADCERFGCGYAPRGWDNLVRHLASRGFTQQEMVDAGVARRGNNGVYDYFRGRATWPIRDASKRVLGFGARKLYDDDTISGKYINTPDTVLYHKNQVLYGLDIAQPNIVKKREAVIVEGYTDVMACHIAGVNTAVATCGTAFGEEHAKKIRRLVADDSFGGIQLVGPLKVEGQSQSSRIVFTFDGDSAGKKAALRAFSFDSVFLSQTYVAVARDNLDPCDLRMQYGDEAIRSLINRETVPLYDFVINAAIDRFDLQYSNGQIGAMRAVSPIIAKIRDRSQYDFYIRKTAKKIGIDVDIVRKEVLAERRKQKIKDEDAYATPSYAQMQSTDTSVIPAVTAANNMKFYRVNDTVFLCEQQFISALLQMPYMVDGVLFSRLQAQNFVAPIFRAVFQAVKAVGELPTSAQDLTTWVTRVVQMGGVAIESTITELSAMPLPLAKDKSQGDEQQQRSQYKKYISELLVRLLDLGYLRQIESLHRQMNSLNEVEKIEILQKIDSVEKSRKELQNALYVMK
ncbi:MAG: DNA primase [Bifidobacteriaceae bacterium]|nr:DNA primase [Bifidobacteriaceae bacterium]